MNLQTNGISHKSKTKKGGIRKLRKAGEAQSIISNMLAKNSNLTVDEVMSALHMKHAWASKVLRQVKRKLDKDPKIISKGSAVDKMVTALSTTSKIKKTIKSVTEEKLIAFICLLGIERVEQIVREERIRISKLIGVTK